MKKFILIILAALNFTTCFAYKDPFRDSVGSLLSLLTVRSPATEMQRLNKGISMGYVKGLQDGIMFAADLNKAMGIKIIRGNNPSHNLLTIQDITAYLKNREQNDVQFKNSIPEHAILTALIDSNFINLEKD